MSDLQLPPEAQRLVARIEAHLRESVPLLLTAGGDGDAFALRETESRYLPDTLRAYTAIPPSQRAVASEGEKSAEAELIDALRTLEAATAAHLERLSSAAKAAMRANSSFLAGRFGSVPAATPSDADTAAVTSDDSGGAALPTPTSALIVRQFFSAVRDEARGNDGELLEAVASRFNATFPQLTRVKRSLFRREATAVEIDVPSNAGSLRYMLVRGSRGIEALIVHVVRGVQLKNERVAADVWLEALADHLASYVENHRDAQERLRTVFGSR